MLLHNLTYKNIHLNIYLKNNLPMHSWRDNNGMDLKYESMVNIFISFFLTFM